ncbi:MAG: hypothetical protein EXQ52_14880 [Bryobacterales bacterium]|nr:hypothetical protein [Bryobacterales bacterium]
MKERRATIISGKVLGRAEFTTIDNGQGRHVGVRRSAELVTGATFSAPGTYWLRAVATDGMLETPYDLKVTVVN